MNLTVLGNGDWGTAMADVACRRGHEVRVWGRKPQTGEYGNLQEAIGNSELILFGVPSHAMREVCVQAAPFIPKDALLVSLAKGMEEGSGLRMSEVISAVLKRDRVMALSGPTFAEEMKKGFPGAIVCAGQDEESTVRVQKIYSGEDFRVYTNTDLAGVELGGALKNVIAVAAGACVGLGLGYSSLAALITRGMSELSKVGTALGGQTQTFFGLSGVGDLILTCSSSLSRNRRVGEALGKGQKLPDILKNLKGTAEGIRTSRSVYRILEERRLEAPILREVYAILHQEKPARDAVRSLMGRDPKPEFKSIPQG